MCSAPFLFTLYICSSIIVLTAETSEAPWTKNEGRHWSMHSHVLQNTTAAILTLLQG